jgi:hypothetical protein
MMDDETWLDAKTALSLGFATRIESNPAEQSPEAMARARGFKAMRKFKHTPAQFRLKRSAAENEENENGCTCDCEQCALGHCDACVDLDCHDEACAEAGCPFQQTDPEARTGAAYTRLWEALRWQSAHGLR